MKLEFTLVTPKKIILSSENSKAVVIPATEGYITVYPRHVQMITELTSGIVQIIEDGNIVKYFISGGFAHIENQRLSIITQIAITFGKHQQAAQKIIENAQKKLQELQKFPEKTEQKDETLRYIEITKQFL